MGYWLTRAVLALLMVAGSGGPSRADRSRYHDRIETPALHLDVSLDLRLGADSQRTELGSAGVLRGRVCLQHIFVDDASSQWTDAGERDSLRAVAAAQRFLVAEAAARGIALRFESERVRIRVDDRISDDVSKYLWTDDAVVRALAKLSKQPCDRRGRSGLVRVLHVARVGRSYAVTYPYAWDERVVMFRRELWPMVWNGESHRRAPDSIQIAERPAAYAHEVLHAFGAEDLYQPDARRERAEELYSSDVMLVAHRGLADLSVTTYTAHAIGWSDLVPEALPD